MDTKTNLYQHLDAKQQSLVIISAFTAKGDLVQLKNAFIESLNAGVTINEIKEELVQLYAYCGFPRSLNAIVAFMNLIEERKAKGINDTEGKDASPITDTGNKYETGKKTLETLTHRPENGPKTGVAAFTPVIDTFLKEHLFADIFSRDALSHLQRELITISALISMAGVESQLQAHMGMGLNVGITEMQLNEVLRLIEDKIGKQEANTGKQVLLKVTNKG